MPRLAKKFLGLKCFIAGTKVVTSNGNCNIEDIAVGDSILSYNFQTGVLEQSRVLEVYVNEADIITHVLAGECEIVSTPKHRYYVKNRGWVEAQNLMPHDELVSVDNGNLIMATSVFTESLSEPVKVYNLNVGIYHNYFVSEIGILVHNLGCEDVATNTLKRISKSQIKQLGGEKVTAQIKKQFGRSLSNLYVDSTGNVYVSVNGSNIAQWVGDIATLAEMYR